MVDTDQDEGNHCFLENSTLWARQASSILFPTGPMLVSLELVETRFIDEAAAVLGESLAAFGASLTRFSVAECNLMDEQLGALIEGLVRCHENHPESFSLESLDISFNKGRDRTTNQLSQLLQATRLKKLAMGFQAFGEGRRIDLRPVFWSIRQNLFLTELDIGGNGIRDVDLHALVDCLGENRSLQVLDLSENRFTNCGLERLAWRLVTIPNLVHILLEDIPGLDQESVWILANALLPSNNYQIHTIEVAPKLMECPAWCELACRLDLNWSGIYEFRDENGAINIPLSLWPLLAQRVCNPHRYGMTTRVPDFASLLFYLVPLAVMPH